MMNQVEGLKRKLVKAHKILYMEGVREFIMGHVSVRVPGENLFLVPGHVHEIGGGIEDVSLEYINVCDLEGNKLEGELPNLEELVIHTSVYKNRRDVASVVHAHPPMTIALSISGKTILPISAAGIYWGVSKPGAVALLDNDWPFISDQKDARELIRALGKRRAVVHRGHGMVTVGRSIEEACITAIMIEHTARMQLLASLVGQPKVFSEKTIRNWEEGVGKHVLENNDIWSYLENKLKKWEAGKIPGGPIPPL
jgi:L-fuculose-phosphate aldolase